MKKIFLLSTMVITSFGAMNLQSLSAAPQQTEAAAPSVNAQAKRLVSKINQAVNLAGDQFTTVNNVCIDYYQKVASVNAAKPADADAQIAALKKTRDEKVKALLTPAQLKSWSSFKD